MDIHGLQGIINILENMRDHPGTFEQWDPECFENNDAAQRLRAINPWMRERQALGANYLTPFWRPYRCLLHHIG